MRIDMLKINRKKKMNERDFRMKNLTYAIITGVIAVVLIVFLGRSVDYAYKYYQYRKMINLSNSSD